MSSKKIRIFKYLFWILAYVGLFLPISIYVGINYETFFTKKETLSIAIGGILAVIAVILLVKVGFKKINQVWWSALLVAISYCLDTIMEQMLYISCMIFIGTLAFSIFKEPAIYFSKRLETFTRVNDSKTAEQEYITKHTTNGSV